MRVGGQEQGDDSGDFGCGKQASNTSTCANGAMPTIPTSLLAVTAINPAIAVPCR